MAAYERSEDGLYHCTVEGCTQPGYERPQHLGLHLFHKHGIKGTARKSSTGSKPIGRPRSDGTPPRQRNRPLLSADDVCSAALEAVAPNGSIPIAAIPAYNAWVDQTRAFFVYLLG